MSSTATKERARKHHSPTGVPIVASFAPTPREDREAVKAWWQSMGRLALMSLSLSALSGCGAGSAEGEIGSLRPVAVGGAILPVDGKPTAVIVTIRTGRRGAQ